MPWVWGLSSTTLEDCIFLRPSAFNVAFWFFGYPIPLLICVIFTFAMSLSVKNFTQTHAAGLTDGEGIPHLDQRVKSGLDHVVRIGRSFGLRKYVCHTCALEHSPHRTAGDNTGTV